MIIYLEFVILFKLFVNKYFINIENNHSLFRSFFCFFISTLSLFNSIIEWNSLILNPIGSTYLSVIINKLMFSYMLIDTFYFIYNKNIRIELIFHHIICIIFYGLFYDKAILSFCSCAEILSSFNWIGILYPEIEWTNKLFRLYSIIFIRLFIWIYTLVFMSKFTYYYYITICLTIIFICLDCYWASIIISNYYKHKSFIKKKIISHTNKTIKNIGFTHDFKKINNLI